MSEDGRGKSPEPSNCARHRNRSVPGTGYPVDTTGTESLGSDGGVGAFAARGLTGQRAVAHLLELRGLALQILEERRC